MRQETGKRTPGADLGSGGMIERRLSSDDSKVVESLGGQTKGLMNMEESHIQPPDLFPSLQERNSCASQQASAQLCQTFASITDNRL